MNTSKTYYKQNEKIGEFKYSKKRSCHFCGGTLVKYDFEDGIDLYMCLECNASDVIEHGKRKFMELY